MITRIYAHNYKSLVNTEIELEPLTLLLGENGSGKSAIFEVLGLICRFLDGTAGLEYLSEDWCTKWIDSQNQTFEIDLKIEESDYSYQLDISRASDRRLVQSEILEVDGKEILHFEDGEVELLEGDSEEILTFPHKTTESAVGTALEVSENQALHEFWEHLILSANVKLLPPLMVKKATNLFDEERASWGTSMEHFATWYRENYQEYPTATSRIFDAVGDVIHGFSAAKLADIGGDSRRLEFLMEDASGDEQAYSFEKISDGERAIFALYSLLHFQREKRAPLLIDEPANYIGLKELTPFLFDLEDYVIEHGGQALLISHHPKILDIDLVTLFRTLMRLKVHHFSHTQPETHSPGLSVVAFGYRIARCR